MQERYDAPSWRRLSECLLKIELLKPKPTQLNVIRFPMPVDRLLSAEMPLARINEAFEHTTRVGPWANYPCALSTCPSTIVNMPRLHCGIELDGSFIIGRRALHAQRTAKRSKRVTNCPVLKTPETRRAR